jgi:hypothetical protein
MKLQIYKGPERTAFKHFQSVSPAHIALHLWLTMPAVDPFGNLSSVTEAEGKGEWGPGRSPKEKTASMAQDGQK